MPDRLSREACEEALDGIVAAFSGAVGLYARDPDTGEEVARDADSLYPTASVIKLAVLAETLRIAAEEGLDLDRRVEVRGEDIVGGSGVLCEFVPGLMPTIRDLATLMVVVSDNTATNLLIDLAGGVEAVNRTVRERLGLGGVILHNRIDFAAIGGEVRRLAEATPRDMALLVERLADPATLGADAAAEAMRIMRRQHHLDQVPRYVEVMPFAKDLGQEERLWAAAKTGFFPGTWVDAGMLGFPGGRRVVYCAMTHASADRAMSSEPEGAVTNGKIGRALVAYWWPEGAGAAPLRESAWLREAGGQ
ncbi:MAG: serine hydrolase [Chloroflexota bacterium]